MWVSTILLSTIIAGFEVKMTSIRVLDVSVSLVGWVISCFIFRLVHKLFNVLDLEELTSTSQSRSLTTRILKVGHKQALVHNGPWSLQSRQHYNQEACKWTCLHNWWKPVSDIPDRSLSTLDFKVLHMYVHTPPPNSFFLFHGLSRLDKLYLSISPSAFFTLDWFGQDSEIATIAYFFSSIKFLTWIKSI